ncbi:MAG: tRNA lysidine(34) synthetase TilS [Bacteroidales bacterium]|nr:tRNA lysidine(34) synthetase TilS [Bacteroidales bacterium]
MLLLAVSGGVDSMTLAEKVRLEGGPFAMAHCNFGLRGAESDADEALVRGWAASHGVVCHVKRFNTRDYARERHISIEMAARELRYRWFGALCTEFGYAGVAVAHNANDNAETLILNLLRGTGLRGLTGMRASGVLPVRQYAHIPLYRPLLGMTREEILAFAREHAVPWREDATNASCEYKRNKIRNLVFPVFAEINPSFVRVLNRDMERIATELACEHKNGLPGARPEGSEHILTPAGARKHENGGSEHKMGLSGAQTAEVTITEEPWDGSQGVKQPAGMLILDADKTGEYAEGFWESGDWIRPLGAPGRKKLQDWFTDHHIPAGEKPLIPLLKSAQDPHHVLAVVGHCIDNSVRVTPATRCILRISVKNV